MGSYSEYREYMQEKHRAGARAARAAEKEAKESARKAAGQVAATRDDSQSKRKLSWKEQREKEQLEAELPLLEERKATLEAQMSSGTLDIATLTAKSKEIEQLIADIDLKELRWLELESSAD